MGGIAAGAIRIDSMAGALDNIIETRLFRHGHVAYVSKSGGLSNELKSIISLNTDGVYEGGAPSAAMVTPEVPLSIISCVTRRIPRSGWLSCPEKCEGHDEKSGHVFRCVFLCDAVAYPHSLLGGPAVPLLLETILRYPFCLRIAAPLPPAQQGSGQNHLDAIERFLYLLPRHRKFLFRQGSSS